MGSKGGVLCVAAVAGFLVCFCGSVAAAAVGVLSVLWSCFCCCNRTIGFFLLSCCRVERGCPF